MNVDIWNLSTNQISPPVYIPPHTGGFCLRQYARVTVSSADSSRARQAINTRVFTSELHMAVPMARKLVKIEKQINIIFLSGTPHFRLACETILTKALL